MYSVISCGVFLSIPCRAMIMPCMLLGINFHALPIPWYIRRRKPLRTTALLASCLPTMAEKADVVVPGEFSTIILQAASVYFLAPRDKTLRTCARVSRLVLGIMLYRQLDAPGCAATLEHVAAVVCFHPLPKSVLAQTGKFFRLIRSLWHGLDCTMKKPFREALSLISYSAGVLNSRLAS